MESARIDFDVISMPVQDPAWVIFGRHLIFDRSDDEHDAEIYIFVVDLEALGACFFDIFVRPESFENA